MGAQEYLTLCSTIRLDILDLLGSGYVIDHCIAALKEKNERRAAVVYITDTLKILNENVTRIGGGSTLKARYIDLVETKEPEPVRSSEQIINSIKDKLRMMGGENK